jgi:cytochrome P450
MTVAAELFGVPLPEALAFSDWENAMLTGTTKDEVENGATACYEFALRMIALKERSPGKDLFTKLLKHRDAGTIDDDELASTFVVLMVGGGEASNAISSGFMLLLSHPDMILEARKNSAIVPSIVDEILRWESPFRILPPRFSDKPIVLGDVTIPAGEMIAVCPAAANRDPSHFPHADRFEPSNRSREHLSFGDGMHKCLGSLLGKMEVEEAVRALARWSAMHHFESNPQSARWRPGDFMRRLDRFIVILHRLGMPLSS